MDNEVGNEMLLSSQGKLHMKLARRSSIRHPSGSHEIRVVWRGEVELKLQFTWAALWNCVAYRNTAVVISENLLFTAYTSMHTAPH